MTDFSEYVHVRGPALLRFAFLVIGDGNRAEDAVQEALARAWPRWSRIDQVEDVDAYVRRMIINANISRWRRTTKETLVEVLPNAPSTDDPYGAVDLHEMVWELLSTLPRRQRAAVVLRHYEAMPDREIAAVLECSEQTVRSQISRALSSLRRRMQVEEVREHG